MNCTTHQHCWGDQIENNEMGGGHVARMGEERCIQGFGVWWGET